MTQQYHIAFFGTPELCIPILDALHDSKFRPELLITAPSKESGRGMKMRDSAVKVWGRQHTTSVREVADSHALVLLQETKWDFFVVVAFGMILPKWVLDLPRYGALNVHYSLLPRYRGASPVETALLHGDSETGTTIILMDEKMDHGRILGQEKIMLDKNNLPTTHSLQIKLSQLSAPLLIHIMDTYIQGTQTSHAQDESHTTYTKKITKADGEVSESEFGSHALYRKFKAYTPRPGLYFFAERNDVRTRVKITDVAPDGTIRRVIPENMKEVDFDAWSLRT